MDIIDWFLSNENIARISQELRDAHGAKLVGCNVRDWMSEFLWNYDRAGALEIWSGTNIQVYMNKMIADFIGFAEAKIKARTRRHAHPFSRIECPEARAGRGSGVFDGSARKWRAPDAPDAHLNFISPTMQWARRDDEGAEGRDPSSIRARNLTSFAHPDVHAAPWRYDESAPWLAVDGGAHAFSGEPQYQLYDLGAQVDQMNRDVARDPSRSLPIGYGTVEDQMARVARYNAERVDIGVRQVVRVQQYAGRHESMGANFDRDVADESFARDSKGCFVYRQ
jgi:hypothetical protein